MRLGVGGAAEMHPVWLRLVVDGVPMCRLGGRQGWRTCVDRCMWLSLCGVGSCWGDVVVVMVMCGFAGLLGFAGV